MTWKLVTPTFLGDTQHFGGDDGLNKYADLFNGNLDIDSVDINSSWTFRSGKGKIRNPANTFSYSLIGSAIGADRDVTLPLLSQNGNFVIDSFANVFTVAQTMANNTFFGARDSIGTFRSVFAIDVADNLLFGAVAGINDIYFYSGSATPGLRIDNTNSVLISPTWAVPLTLNNNLNYLMKDSAGTARQVAKINSTNTLVIGDSAGMTSIDIFSGNATNPFLRVNSSNVATLLPEMGIAQIHSNGIWEQWKDAGGTARNVLRAVNDDVYLANYTTLGDIYFLVGDGASTVGSISQGGLWTFNRIGGVSEFEEIARFKVSDTAISYYSIQNSVNVDGKYGPFFLYLLGVGEATSTRAAYNRAQIDATLDTGSASLFLYESRQAGLQIANRGLFEIMNLAQSTWYMSAKGAITHTVIAQAGIGETLHTFKTSDDASGLDIRNATTTDALFAPWILGSLSVTHGATTNALRISGFIPTAQDSGTTAAIRFDTSLQSGGAIVTRPLFDFMNVGTSVFKINANGDQVVTALARAGITESLADFKVSDNAGFIRLTNNTTIDGAFGGQLDITLATGSSTSTLAMIYVHRILAANDGGSNPIVQFQAKTTTFTDIVTRPLFDFVNNATTLISIRPKGKILQTYQDEGLEEVLYDVSLSDAAGSYFRIGNALGGVASSFAPRIWGHNALANTTYGGLYIFGSVAAAQDGGSSGIITIDSRLDSGGIVVNKDLVHIRNLATIVCEIAANGNFTNTIKAQAGVRELVHKWVVGDDGGGYLQIQNNSITDGVFVPRIQSNLGSAASSTDGFEIRNYVNTTDETGTAPIFRIDGRRSDETAILTRALIGVYNAGVSVLQIFPDKVDLGDKLLTEVYGVQQEPTQRYVSLLISPTNNGIGSGAFGSGSTFTGTLQSTNDASGGYTRVTAATGIDSLAQMVSDVATTSRQVNPKWQFYFAIDSLLDVRFKMGLNTTSSFSTGAVTIATANAGIAFRYIAGTDTTIKVVHNDAVTGETVVDTLFTPVAITMYVFEIDWDGTDWTWTIYNNSGVSQATGNITTNMPSTSHVLFRVVRTENTTATAKSWFFRWEKLYKNGAGPALPM